MNAFARTTTPQGLRSTLAPVGVVAMVLTASCAPAIDTGAIAKELTRLDDRWSTAAATKNADTVAAFYAADAIAYAPIAIGQPAGRKA